MWLGPLLGLAGMALAGVPRPPVSPFAPDEYTLLLAHFDYGCHADFATGGAEARGMARIVRQGRFGGAVEIAEGDHLILPGGDNFPGETGTAEFWLRPSWNGNDGQPQSVLSAARDALNYFNINKLPNGRFGVGMAGGTSKEDFVYRRADYNVASWKAGEWHHVAVCWGQGQLGLWLDGRLAAEAPGAVPPRGPVKAIQLSGNGIAVDELQISRVVRYTADGMVKGKPVNGRKKLHADWHFLEPPGVYRAASLPVQAEMDMAIIPKNYLDEADPRALAATTDSPAVTLFAAAGQTEPAALIVVARSALHDVRIAVSDLKCGSRLIPATCATVRRVIRTPMRRLYTSPPDQTEIVNRFLPRWEPLEIPAQEFREVWLSLDVPRDVQPGKYSGEVVLTHSAGNRRLPLNLEVLPIRLIEHPRKQLGCYYDLGERLLEPDRVSRELRDMHDHGVWHLIVGIGVRYLRRTDGITSDLRGLRVGLELICQAGFRDATVVVDSGLEGLAVLLGHRSKDGKISPAAVAGDPQFQNLAKSGVQACMSLAHEFPELKLVLTHLDEIFNESRLPLYLELSKAVRQVPEAKLYITFHTVNDQTDQWRRLIDPWVDIRCHHGYTFEWWLSRGHTMDEYERELAASGDDAWFYHNARGVHFTAKWARIINGLYLWASPFRVHCPWTYQAYHENPFDDTDGGKLAHDFGMSMPGIDSPADLVPTRIWEAMRTGGDDLRYFAALENAIANARGRKPQQAAAAEAFLNQVRGLVRNARPAAGSASASSGTSGGAVDLDTGLQMGQGVVGSAKEAPLIDALANRLSGDGLQQLRRQVAEWIIRLENPE